MKKCLQREWISDSSMKPHWQKEWWLKLWNIETIRLWMSFKGVVQQSLLQKWKRRVSLWLQRTWWQIWVRVENGGRSIRKKGSIGNSYAQPMGKLRIIDGLERWKSSISSGHTGIRAQHTRDRQNSSHMRVQMPIYLYGKEFTSESMKLQALRNAKAVHHKRCDRRQVTCDSVIGQ